MAIHKTDDVYGITRELPLNYVARDSVDEKLLDQLSRRQHIVIYGSSKQGKTSLRKHILVDSDYIIIQCQNKWGIGDLHANILKRAGYQITQSQKRSATGRAKLLAKVGAKVFGVGGGVGSEVEQGSSFEQTTAPLELDDQDVNDVIAALKAIEFRRFIVLEDFHYLSVEAQKDFAVALKAFHESSQYCFIIIGVWLEENRLVVYNGDLTGRVVSVDADRWSIAELKSVIDKGAELLNVDFANAFKEELIQNARHSVYIVQEACRSACRAEHVFETQPDCRQVAARADVPALVKSIVDQQSGRYTSFLNQFADGFQDTRLQMFRWLLYPILERDVSQLGRGLTYADIRRSIQAVHPEGPALNLGNLTQALLSVSALQVTKDIKPIILDYDQTNRRLSIVDRGFLVWLAQQDRKEIMSDLRIT